jgi:hypothetical protein
MNRNLKLAWVCVLGSLAGLALLVTVNQQQATELAKLRSEHEQSRSESGSTDKKPQANGAELARSRQEHQELLRLRNEVHQLGLERGELSRKLQRTEAQAQQAAEQAQQAESQVQLLREKAAQTAQQPPTPTLEARTRFLSRYGLKPNSPEEAAAVECINNLRQIEGAKQQWALEHNKSKGVAVTEADIAPYLPGNALPKCPSGGTYTLNVIGAKPACSITGHVLP